MNNRIKFDIDDVITELKCMKMAGFENCHFTRRVNDDGNVEIVIVGVDIDDDSVYSERVVKSI